MINIAVSLIIIIIYIYIISKSYYLKCNKAQKVLFFLLLLVHFVAMILAYSDDIIDANIFYETAKTADSWFSIFGLGSQFMAFLIYPFVEIGISKFVLYFLFSTISFQAFIWYFEHIDDFILVSKKVIWVPFIKLFFLLPSLHYWSGFVGKDALVFFFLTFLFFEVKNKKVFNFLHLIVLVLFLLLRPHVFAMAFLAFLIHFTIQEDVSNRIKIKLFLFAFFVFCIFLLIMMKFLKIESLSFEILSEYWKQLNLYSINIRNGINLKDSNILERIGLLLFRPLFYDATTLYQYIISVENCLVLLLFVIVISYLFVKRNIIKFYQETKLALLLGFFIMIMIASYIYNLGLASRMRLMFLPLFFYAFHQLVFEKHFKKE